MPQGRGILEPGGAGQAGSGGGGGGVLETHFNYVRASVLKIKSYSMPDTNTLLFSLVRGRPTEDLKEKMPRKQVERSTVIT